LLPRALPLLQTRYPKLRLYLREEQSAALLEGLAQGRLDLVLLALPYDIGDLETMSVGRDELVLVCPANHALADLREVTTAALAGTEMLMLEEGHCLREHALRACGRAANSRRDPVATSRPSGVSMTRRLVRSTNAAPSPASSSWMPALKVDCDTAQAAAAFPKCRWSARAQR
jgi:LysR family transcriptional regulator, hydrogen peroxide-inducible genes activator